MRAVETINADREGLAEGKGRDRHEGMLQGGRGRHGRGKERERPRMRTTATGTRLKEDDTRAGALGRDKWHPLLEGVGAGDCVAVWEADKDEGRVAEDQRTEPSVGGGTGPELELETTSGAKVAVCLVALDEVLGILTTTEEL